MGWGIGSVNQKGYQQLRSLQLGKLTVTVQGEKKTNLTFSFFYFRTLRVFTQKKLNLRKPDRLACERHGGCACECVFVSQVNAK